MAIPAMPDAADALPGLDGLPNLHPDFGEVAIQTINRSGHFGKCLLNACGQRVLDHDQVSIEIRVWPIEGDRPYSTGGGGIEIRSGDHDDSVPGGLYGGPEAVQELDPMVRVAHPGLRAAEGVGLVNEVIVRWGDRPLQEERSRIGAQVLQAGSSCKRRWGR